MLVAVAQGVSVVPVGGFWRRRNMAADVIYDLDMTEMDLCNGLPAVTSRRKRCSVQQPALPPSLTIRRLQRSADKAVSTGRRHGDAHPRPINLGPHPRGAASRGSSDQGASPGASGEAWRLRPWRGLAWTVPSWLCSPSYLMSTLPEWSAASCRHATELERPATDSEQYDWS